MLAGALSRHMSNPARKGVSVLAVWFIKSCMLRVRALTGWKSSMNSWSIARDFGKENLRYSSKMDVLDQHCIFRRQPTRQPVRCFPLLQWISRGWFRLSSTTDSARRIFSSGIVTKGSYHDPVLSVIVQTIEKLSKSSSILPYFQEYRFAKSEFSPF